MFTSTIQPATQKAEFLESKKTNESSLLNGRAVKPLLLNSKEKGGACFSPSALGAVIVIAAALFIAPFAIAALTGTTVGAIAGAITANPFIGLGVGVAVTAVAFVGLGITYKKLMSSKSDSIDGQN